MAQYTSLVDIYTSRPDLQKAFPQGTVAGTTDNQKFNNWWNQYGVREYPNITLVQPGDRRIQDPKTLTAEAQVQPTAPDVDISVSGIDLSDAEIRERLRAHFGSVHPNEDAKVKEYKEGEKAGTTRTYNLRTSADQAWTAKQTVTPPSDTTGAEAGELTNYDYWKIYQEFGLDISEEELATHTTNQTGLDELRDWLVENQGTLVEARAALTPRLDAEPYQEISTERRAELREAAEAGVVPYYEEKAAIPTREARLGIQDIYGEMRIAKERGARNLTQALDESSAAMAARGLAFSGIREKAATDVAIQQQEALSDVMRPLESQRKGVMRGLEETIGTQATQQLYPDYQLSPEFRELYGGREGITGSVARERMESIEEALSGRLSEEREQRQFDYLSQFQTGYGL